MDFSFFFGPDKLSFVLNDQGMIESGEAMPFHGIISRGLLNKFLQERLPSRQWYDHAHRILPAREEADPELTRLREYAGECGALSFAQSAGCAKKYVEQYVDGMKEDYGEAGREGENIHVELWNIKEGHTSSVWKIAITGISHFRAYSFILNIARDRDAGEELWRTSETMKAIAEKFPTINMAKVLDISQIRLEYSGESLDVVTTRNEWVEGAQEIHLLKDKATQEEEFILVERFLTIENDPSRISSIYGRKFTPPECEKIRSDIDAFLHKASTVISLELCINDGDVVWDHGRAVVVAIS